MTQTKHTPGKLELVYKNDKYSKDEPLIIEREGKDDLHEVICGTIMNEEKAAELVHRWNCYEELLEACKKILHLYSDPSRSEIAMMLEMVISKAEGSRP